MIINQDLVGKSKTNWSILIEDRDITSVSVYLSNKVPESRYRTRINLNEIKYCGEYVPEEETLLLEMKGKNFKSNDH